MALKLILPFTTIDQWYFERYHDQFKAYCENFDRVIVPVYRGYSVENDLPNLEFDYYKLLKPGFKRSLRRKIKDFTYKIAFLPLLIRRNLENERMIEHWKNRLDGDVILSYSGSGLNQMLHCDLGEALGVPVVHRMRGNGVKERGVNLNPLSAYVSNHYHYKSLSRYDRHIPINFDYHDLLLYNWKVPRHKVSDPVGLGVDLELFKPMPKPPSLTLGYFGRVSREKNIGFLLEVMRQTPEIRYIIVGKKISRGIKFPSNCHYMGFVSKKEMPEYYHLVNGVVNPSLTEGFPNILLEAYATRTPVIGSVETFPQGIPVYGYALDLSVELWVHHIKNLTTNKLAVMGSRALREAEDHSWQTFGVKMRNQIQRVEKNG